MSDQRKCLLDRNGNDRLEKIVRGLCTAGLYHGPAILLQEFTKMIECPLLGIQIHHHLPIKRIDINLRQDGNHEPDAC